MADVLWISAIGGALLFGALLGLVGLMYALTWPGLFPIEGVGEPPMRPRKKRRFRKRAAEAEPAAVAPSGQPSAEAENEAEQERRRRAAALAVATACAEDGQMLTIPADSPGGWRQLNRARQRARASGRQRSRR